MDTIKSDEYVPLNLWVRQDQMDRLMTDSYDQSTTLYSLIRIIIDTYYQNKDGKNND